MKKRIISGVVMGAIVLLVLVLGLYIENTIITIFVAGVAALGVTELVSNAAGIKNKVFKILSAVYTAVMVYIFCNVNIFVYKLFMVGITNEHALKMRAFLVAAIGLSVIYVIANAFLILYYQEEFDLSKIAVVCGMPIVYAFGFSCLASIIIFDEATLGVYYLLLMLNFACVCDTGAYFVGVNIGKTKLCPNISPNKTVEGALGGIASCVIVSLVITLCFGRFSEILPVLMLTIPFCAVGMAGDLFASIIKRKVGIKDYSNLIPGHGGILDRVDSMLFIAPLMFPLICLGVL